MNDRKNLRGVFKIDLAASNCQVFGLLLETRFSK